MRFLMLNWRDPMNPQAGGAERVTLAYLSELVRRGHEVWWFANDFPGAKMDEIINGIRLVRGGGKGTSILRAMQWYRRQKRFDLVIDQQHGLPWYAPWWCGTNCIAYIHEVLGPIWDAFYPWPINLVGRVQERWTHGLYRRVPFWTASSCTKEILQRHGVKLVKQIPYGVDTLALPELDPKPLNSPLRLAVVSRLAPNKRIDHAVRMVKCLVDGGVDVRLTIVGGGDAEPLLRGLVREMNLDGRVNFAGRLAEAEKDARLREAHFLIHTSQREGWGLNVIEANAMGTPAAVYPVEGLIESTLHNQTGLVAETETPASLAASLVNLLKTPEKYQGFRAQALARAREFHWSQVLSTAAEWLESQATNPPRR